jgi:hypothetical protein
MKKSVFSFLSLFLLYLPLPAQEINGLYLPRNLQEAYNNGTRGYDGRPGPQHWVNHSDYRIAASFSPLENHLRGLARITYCNNSPDTLSSIVVRLYQDLYRKGNARDFFLGADDLHDGVELGRIIINGDSIDLTPAADQFQRRGTNAIIKPRLPILPNSKAIIEISWSCQFPTHRQVRMGGYDSTSFFIAYWYPQISVYDDLNGWDLYNYSGSQEFYLDPARFDVKLTLPARQRLWATGRLQNAEEVLPEPFLTRYKRALSSDDIVNIIDSTDIVPVNSATRTWHFVAESAPDFAWATSSHYLWDAGSIEIDGRRVLVGAAYAKTAEDYYEVAAIARASIDFFSNEMPAYPYPFPSMTIVHGRGGMEFPMLVNDGSMRSRDATVGVTSHEIAHTYMPFYLTTNERKYAFMDEGFAVFLPFAYQQREMTERDPVLRNLNGYLRFAGTDMEVPLMLPSIISGSNALWPTYRVSAYGRSAVAYNLLYDYLGHDVFVAALQEYIHTWAGKHPLPYDFFFTFARVSGKNLNWFWQTWFFDHGYPDLSIADVRLQQGHAEVVIERIGHLPVPVDLHIHYADGKHELKSLPLDIWANGDDQWLINLVTDRQIEKVALGDKYLPDVDRANNYWPRQETNE